MPNKLEFQAVLLLKGSDDNIKMYPLYEYCNAVRSKQAACIMHSRIRSGLDTDDTFYIYVFDETDSKSGYFECKVKAVDNKIKCADGQIVHYVKQILTNRKKIGEVEESLRSSSDEVVREFKESFGDYISGNIERIAEAVGVNIDEVLSGDRNTSD